MFTGLIEHMGVLHAAEQTPAGRRLVVHCPGLASARSVVLGASIAVDGVCLTVAQPPDARAGLLTFDVIPETLAKTTLGTRRPGDRLHLEESATLATLLGGHLVQGHVDGVARVESVRTQGEWRTRFVPPAQLMPFLAPKGSVCVQGVSLTIAEVSPAQGWFEVALIPTTLEKTTLGGLKAGDGVNLECDAIAKQVVHWLTHYAPSGRSS